MMAYINGNEVLFSAQFSGLVAIDTEMSDTSENPVENKVAKAYVDEKTAPATSMTYGTVKAWTDSDTAQVGGGIYMDEDGYLRLVSAPEDNIDMRLHTAPITPQNLEYAVKSVGDGYYAKVEDMPKGKVYEHIATITVTADEDGTLPTKVTISADRDGNPFELTDFYVVSKFGSNVSGNTTFHFYINGNIAAGNCSIYQGTSLRAHYFRFDYDEVRQYAELKYPGTTLSNPNGAYPDANISDWKAVGVPSANIGWYTPVTQVGFALATSSNYFIDGSTFELWGVRK